MANSSYFTSGGNDSETPRSLEPAIDKNPIYKTNDTFRRAYRKNITVLEGQVNQTDCHSIIWVKFADPIDQRIVEPLGLVEHSTARKRYLLECGHEWEGKNNALVTAAIGARVACMVCGSEQAYLGFEHEWQHIIFKTDPAAAKIFIQSWAQELRKSAPHVEPVELERFLFYVLNSFDDIRCNSLWELLYAGSADRIWKRWTRISTERGPEANSENFIAFLFAVALGTPTLPDGIFEHARPYVAWGMQSVKYKGFRRALEVARIALSYCLDAVLQDLFQPPPPQLVIPPSFAGDSNGNGEHQTESTGNEGDHHGKSDSGGAGGGARDSSDAADGGGVPAAAPQSGGDPQPQDQGQGDIGAQQRIQTSSALRRMMQSAAEFDKSERHQLTDATPTALDDGMRASIAQILRTDAQSPEAPQDLTKYQGFVDPEMDAAITQFRDGVTKLSPDSQLVSDARAKVLFIDVKPENIDDTTRILLSPDEQEAVTHMRSVFFRTQGRQRNQRSSSGSQIDIDAAIQNEIEPVDTEIFEQEDNNQGFAYLTLCDMSGSMQGERFRQVCHGTEMLKRSLRFPFVHGTLWGFRGGEKLRTVERDSEVWLYRYDPRCSGYIGAAKIPGKGAAIPVECGGNTPMHTALRVASRHMLTQLPTGLAKRIFLLTDGSPCGSKFNGTGLPLSILQQFVAKEIQWARQRGIQVYTLVIDGGLDERECRLMFGIPRFWRTVSSIHDENSIDRVLQDLVIQNFERYLKMRS